VRVAGWCKKKPHLAGTKKSHSLRSDPAPLFRGWNWAFVREGRRAQRGAKTSGAPSRCGVTAGNVFPAGIRSGEKSMRDLARVARITPHQKIPQSLLLSQNQAALELCPTRRPTLPRSLGLKFRRATDTHGVRSHYHPLSGSLDGCPTVVETRVRGPKGGHLD